jgi:dipeptidyl aminopeptidase/acylaminoacyl peptidase
LKTDFRTDDLFVEAQRAALKQVAPGSGLLVDAQEFHASPDGFTAVFAGAMYEKLEGTAKTKICTIDLESGAIHIRTMGSGTDRLPRFSPSGETIAFLSDRSGPAGNFQLYFMDAKTWLSRPGPAVDGFIESIEWSSDGRRLLLSVAGAGADLSGAQGGLKVNLQAGDAESWMPSIDCGVGETQWRTAWLLDSAADKLQRISPAGMNIWECVWCGPDTIAAIVSDSPDEASWYRATVKQIGLDGAARTIHVPRDQLGWIAASTTGNAVAVVEAICSDRTIVAGDIVVLRDNVAPARVTAQGVDVSHLRFTGASKIAFAGHRSFETVLGEIDAADLSCGILWSDSCSTWNFRYPDVAPLPDGKGFIATLEAFDSQPAIHVLGAGCTQRRLATIGSDDVAHEVTELVHSVEAIHWHAPDGLEIHGWLIRPRTANGPMPLVMEIHGGPVWQWRARWLGGSVLRRMLLRRGYSLFLPNPRGSSGRGQAYAERVFGDMGGADTHDYLSGVEHLVRTGVADPANLFVTGGSYGGFMSSWLITQDTRFAAAVPVAPVTNWFSEHLVCHIPYFCTLFLKDELTNPAGKYFSRSPVFQARNVKTPTLSIAGALDRNTPPTQAVEFHHALLENGVESVLAIYPCEGHGVRTYPGIIDFSARVVDWFERHRRS